MPTHAAQPHWPVPPELAQCLGMVVSAAVLLLGVSVIAAICAHCHSAGRRFALVTGVLVLMIASTAWTLQAAFLQ